MGAMRAGKMESALEKRQNRDDTCRRAEFRNGLSYDTTPAADIQPSGTG